MNITNKNNNKLYELILLNNIQQLPEVIIELIKEYIQHRILLFLNKTYYIKFHYLVTNIIKNKSEIYIRSIVRQDLDYVLNMLFFENLVKWVNMRNYYYKDTIYLNYIYFLYHYTIEYEAYKCKELLNRLYIQNRLEKNQHKKKTVRYIKWKI